MREDASAAVADPSEALAGLRVVDFGWVLAAPIGTRILAGGDTPDSQKDALLAALRQAIGSKVQMDLRIDRGLIGGLVVKVGSRMIDTSLRSKLERLELAMKGAG